MSKPFVLLSLGLLWASPGCGHGLSGSGLMHPLTGLDHFLAMIAVGAWSAQLGGKALFIVPGCFLLAMLLGGVIGLSQLSSPYLDGAIATSVILLGLAISADKRISWTPAGLAVGLFGFSHGVAHGLEITYSSTGTAYITGFLVTTAGLHIVGAIGGLLILEDVRGRKHLRVLGAITAIIGVYLLSRFVMDSP